MIDSDTLVVVADHQVSSVVDDEQVILNLEDGTYHGLNSVGARVWQLIQEPRTVAAICDALLAQFDVARDRVHQDVVALLQDLKQENLIRIEQASPKGGRK